MRILLTSDTHIGGSLTSPSTLKKMFRSWRDEQFDVVVHAGDYCGGYNGARSINTTCAMMREVTDKPIISVMGNHDFWCDKRPSLLSFNRNYDKAVASFKKHNVHFLDEDGPYVHGDVVILGCTGWYSNNKPNTNDLCWMPQYIEGDTHFYMARRAHKIIDDQLQSVDLHDKKPIFVSHFPIYHTDTRPLNPQFDGPRTIGDTLSQHHGCKVFINGHAHRRHEGPDIYEAGSDYGKPKYLLIDL